MSFGPDKLDYTPTNADTLAASSTIGAYTLDGSGTRITSTLVGAKQSLDVYVANGLTVNLDGIYNVTTNPTPDNVGTIMFTRGATPGLSAQVETPTVATPGSDAVAPANVHAQDVISFNYGYNGTTWDRITATAGAMDVNLKTSAATVTVSDAALANTAAASNAKAVTTTASNFVTTALANRKYFYAQNLGGSQVYIGATGVTAATGIRLSNGTLIDGRLGAAVQLQVLTQAGTADLRTLEFS